MTLRSLHTSNGIMQENNHFQLYDILEFNDSLRHMDVAHLAVDFDLHMIYDLGNTFYSIYI